MITYVHGDATNPIGDGPFLLPHICNDSGGWGKGYVLALSKRWPEPETEFRAWARTGKDGVLDKPYELGRVQFIQVSDDPFITVANMVAQNGFRPTYEDDGKRYVDYHALRECLRTVNAYTFEETIHMPRIGCGLGGGDWDVIEKIIDDELAGIPVFVYDVPY